MILNANIQKEPRQFLPESFTVTDWASLEPYFLQLAQQPLESVAALTDWLKKVSELEAVVSEDACWRQIKMTCNTEDPELEASFNYFCMEIQPRIQPIADQLNRMLIDCPFTA